MGLFDGLSQTTEDTSPASSGLFAGLSTPTKAPPSINSFIMPGESKDPLAKMGVANSTPLFTGLQGPDIKVPFTQKTIPSFGGPVIGAAEKFITELPERLTQDVADIYNQVVHGGTKDTAVFQKGTQRVSDSFSEAAGIADEARSNGYSEAGAKALGTIYGVSSLIADFGPVVGAGAKGVLTLTKFSPELDGALYRLGLDGDSFSIESWAKQTKNASKNLIATGDEAGFHQLTQDYKTISEALNGSGDRATTGVIKKIQDVAKSINQPLDEFINGRPQFNTSGTQDILPGYQRAAGQAPAFGLSTEEVKPVGFAEGTNVPTKEPLDNPSAQDYTGVNEPTIQKPTIGVTETSGQTSGTGNFGRANSYTPQKFVDIRGTQAKNIEEVATSLKDYRNPTKEILHVVYTKGGQVVAHTAFSSDLVDQAGIHQKELIYKINNRGEKLGADGVYVAHNHPSGNITPSAADKSFTANVDKRVNNFKGHIVLDHDKFNEITPSGQIIKHNIDLGKSYASTGGQINGAQDAIEVFKKQYPFEPGKVGVLVINPSNQPVALRKINFKSNIQETIKQIVRETRGTNAIIGVGPDLYNKVLDTIKDDPYVYDIVHKEKGNILSTPGVMLERRGVTGGVAALDKVRNERPTVRLFETKNGYNHDQVEPTPLSPTDVAPIENTPAPEETKPVERVGEGSEPDPAELSRMRSKNLESANRQYLKQSAKEAEADLPRAEIMAVRKQENNIRAEYTDTSKTDTALGNILAQLELSEPGSRTLIGSGTTARMHVIPSTFPKWLPSNLRSKALFEPIIKNVQSLSDLHYPDRINSGRQAELVNAIYDQIDQATGVDTKPLRKNITKLYTSPDVRAEETSKIETEKLSQRQAQHTEKMQTEADKKAAKIKKIQERNAELLQEIAEKQKYKTSLQDKINQAHKEAKLGKGIFAKLKDIMYPVRGLDDITKAITTHWFEQKMVAHALAQEEFEKAKTLGPQNFQEIIDYQAGKNTPYIKEYFDSLGTEFHERGLDFDWRPDYIPQVWKNDGTFKIAMNKYLKGKGLSDEEIANYMAGEPLPPDKAIRLKLRPNFVKERFWPDYASGMAHGLTPRYQTPGELIAYYRQQGELAIANREFIDHLKEQGKLLSADDAPDTWEPVNLRFSREGLYAPPELAHLVNGQMRNEEKLTFMQGMTKGFAKVSKFMFDARTIAGVPMTTINSFAIGQANKLLVSAIGDIATLDFKSALSDLKASFAVIRANSNSASKKFFAANIGYIVKMAENGISIGENYPGNFQKISKKLADVFESPEEGIGMIGKVKNKLANIGHGLKYTLDVLFSDKTIASMMGQIQVQTFKDLYIRGLQKGMNETQAAKMAADITKTFNGMLGEVGRGRTTTDTMGAVFAAPYFREGVLTTLWNGAKSYSTDFNNPAFVKSKKFVIGLIAAFAAYTALNKKLNDKYMWQNPSGHEFDLRIPLSNGDVVYIPFMPSFLAIARNLASGTINLGTGDFDTAKQKLGSVLSTPLELATELLSNKDYYGNQIYNPNDTGKKKTEDLAAYAGLSVTHPYIMETAKYAEGKEPLYQAISKASELPFKFSTLTAEQKNAWYDAQDAKTKERAQAKAKVRPMYDSNQKLKAEGKTDEANAIYNALDPKDKALYDQIKIDEKTKATKARKPVIQGIYDHNQELLQSGRGDEAQSAYLNLSDEDRHVYDLIKKAAQKDQN